MRPRLTLDIVPPQSENHASNTCSIQVVDGKVIYVPTGTSLNPEQAQLTATIEFTGETLGRGASGYVRKARHISSGQYLAVKTVRIDTKHLRGQLLNDISVYHKLRDSEHLVHFHGSYLDDNEINMVFEYMDMGSLHDVLKKVSRASGRTIPPPSVPENIVAYILHETLQGLATLHNNLIIHRDVKPHNLLVSSDGSVRVTDFGISKTSQMGGCLSTFVGTHVYMSPERVLGSSYDARADTWSAGIMAFECLTGFHPLSNCKTFPDVFAKVTTPMELPADAELTAPVSEVARNFVKLSLTLSASERPTCEQLLEHPFLAARASKEFFSAWLGRINARAAMASRKASLQQQHHQQTQHSDH